MSKFDLDEAVELIESGNRVSNEYAKYITSIELQNYKARTASSLSNLVSLQQLRIRRAQLNNIEGLSELTQLKSLFLSRLNKVDTSPLKNLIHLRDLSITGKIEDLSFLREMPHLSRLQITSQEIDDWSPIGSLPSLKYLTIRSPTALSLKAFEQCVELEELTVWSTKIEYIESIVNFKNLKLVDFRRVSGMKSGYLLKLPKLKKVVLKSVTTHSDEDILSLKKARIFVRTS